MRDIHGIPDRLRRLRDELFRGDVLRGRERQCIDAGVACVFWVLALGLTLLAADDPPAVHGYGPLVGLAVFFAAAYTLDALGGEP